LIHKACQVQILTDTKHNDVSVACQTDLSPNGVEDKNNNNNNQETSTSLSETTLTSLSETSSIESSVVSNNEEDIITIVTNDRVSASVLHANSDISSVNEDVVSPLHSPSGTSETKPALSNSEHTTNDGGKKSVRFQDLEHNLNIKETETPRTLDKVGIFHATVLYVQFL